MTKIETTTAYAIRSTSEDGVFFLVNGWRKCKKFWTHDIGPQNVFKRLGDAKANLTRLLKVMPEYAGDKIEICEFSVAGLLKEE